MNPERCLNAIAGANDLLLSCTVYPRQCRVNRTRDEKGCCKTGMLPVIARYGPHFAEETPLVESKGSGTLVVTHGDLACCFLPAL